MWLRKTPPVALIALTVAAFGAPALACKNPRNQTSFLRAEPLPAAPDGMVMVDVRVIRSPPRPYQTPLTLEAAVTKSHTAELVAGKRVRISLDPITNCDTIPGVGETGVLVGRLVHWDGVVAVVEPQRHKASGEGQ